MKIKLEDKIFDFMSGFAQLRAGPIIMQHRGRVVDKGKSGGLGGDQEEGGLALTVMDQIVQDGFLWDLKRLAPEVRINCEEDTPMKYLFRGNTSPLTVHQDPIDGTKPYVSGLDDFATGYGISDGDNNFTHTVIFAPARGLLYLASPSGSNVLGAGARKFDRAENGHDSNVVYSKRFLNERGKAEAKKAGLEVRGVESAHCRIVDVALGDGAAYLYGQANPHDSFIPYAFARNRGLALVDANARPLTGRDINVSISTEGFSIFERVPSVAYIDVLNTNTNTLMDIVSSRRNIDAVGLG